MNNNNWNNFYSNKNRNWNNFSKKIYYNNKENILWEAIQAQDNDRIRKIVEEQPELLNEPVQYGGDTPLILAARGFVVKGFTTRNNDENIENVSDYTRYTEQAMLLVELGADVNQTNDLGITALFEAIRVDNVPLIKFLLEHGADPNIEDGALLKSALKSENMELIELLVRHKARITPSILQDAHANVDEEKQIFTPKIRELIDYIYGLQQSIRNERDWTLAFGKRGISGFMEKKGIPENVEKIIKGYAKRNEKNGGYKRKTNKRKGKKSKKTRRN